jgi:hypothetical protein
MVADEMMEMEGSRRCSKDWSSALSRPVSRKPGPSLNWQVTGHHWMAWARHGTAPPQPPRSVDKLRHDPLQACNPPPEANGCRQWKAAGTGGMSAPPAPHFLSPSKVILG